MGEREKEEDDSRLGRREFVRQAGLGAYGLAELRPRVEKESPESRAEIAQILADSEWPSLRHYGPTSLDRIALPLGGIGTGTVSLGGRGDLRDFEIMNRPAKGFVPVSGAVAPFAALFAREAGGKAHCRLLEGPLPLPVFEGSHGSPAPNASLPRFRSASFATAYPFGRVLLSDPDLPLTAQLKAFNPFVPGDAEASGLPVAVLEVEVRNSSGRALEAGVSLTLPNFVGMDGSVTKRDWKGDTVVTGARANVNVHRRGAAVQGLLLSSEGVSSKDAAWGTIALVTPSTAAATHRTGWAKEAWGDAILDFWDDFAADGRLDERPATTNPVPLASLAVSLEVPAGERRTALFLLAWHFPNRYSWTAKSDPPGPDDWVGNHYATLYRDAWEVAERTLPRLPELRRRTLAFVHALRVSELPAVVKEAALFNLSTLRTQTCFRTARRRASTAGRAPTITHGCCHGSCTHVWNYEQATAFLFGDLSRRMREVEFGHATADNGLMSFRVHLPLWPAQELGPGRRRRADGLHHEDVPRLAARRRRRVPARALAAVAQARGVLLDPRRLGCRPRRCDGGLPAQHHGRRVLRPEPADGLLVPGRAAGRGGDGAAPGRSGLCRDLPAPVRARPGLASMRTSSTASTTSTRCGRRAIRRPSRRACASAWAPATPTKPDFQLGAGCLVDQLVGQYMAHVCGLGYLADPGARPDDARAAS